MSLDFTFFDLIFVCKFLYFLLLESSAKNLLLWEFFLFCAMLKFFSYSIALTNAISISFGDKLSFASSCNPKIGT